MELQILHAIQELHTDLLDSVMILLSTLGNAGLIWIFLSIVLVFPKRTRRCGFTMIARPRPCAVDTSVRLLIPFPGEYSFPSGHSLNGFTAATVIFLYFKKAGAFALLLAASIAFSRLYLFVHYPTDIFGGMILGILDAAFIFWIVKKVIQRREGRL